ncbi:MAG: hypothetical protein H0W25_19575 [Acidimicrobiia bacterium]|nr:hypothetical protein [Acidimicrobiia bacterium]
MTDLLLWSSLAAGCGAATVMTKRLRRLSRIDRTTDFWVATIKEAMGRGTSTSTTARSSSGQLVG